MAQTLCSWANGDEQDWFPTFVKWTIEWDTQVIRNKRIIQKQNKSSRNCCAGKEHRDRDHTWSQFSLGKGMACLSSDLNGDPTEAGGGRGKKAPG